jgi:hypothetical protein
MGPPSLLFNAHWGSFPGIKGPGREVDTSLLFTLVPRLRMSGAILLFPLYAFKTCIRKMSLRTIVLDGGAYLMRKQGAMPSRR